MPQHEAKRQRLEQLLGARHITRAALATLLREIDSAPVEAASRWTLGNVLKKRCLGSGILIRRATIGLCLYELSHGKKCRERLSC